eukprot:TRINITY_DN32203_c0_g1_i1.p1 TRINITY_DN32203_c0_g1~~TRINITY_DN32203_c0_g1_i1.p1  ORF type:complete len:650 (+),score=120.77 TRINITY_DN32203_c0_g1_i1:173-2122(+)
MFLQFLNTRRTAAGFGVDVECSVKSLVPEPHGTKQASTSSRSRREESSPGLDELLEKVIDEQEQEEALGKQKALRAQRRKPAVPCSPGLNDEHSPVPVRRARKRCQAVTPDDEDSGSKADHVSTPATPSKLLSFITTRTVGALPGRVKASPKQTTTTQEGLRLLQTPQQQRQCGVVVTPKKQPQRTLGRRSHLRSPCGEQSGRSSTLGIPGCAKKEEKHTRPQPAYRMASKLASDDDAYLPVDSATSDVEARAKSKQDISIVSKLDSGEHASLLVAQVAGQPILRGAASETAVRSLAQHGGCNRLREDRLNNMSKPGDTASNAVEQSTLQQEAQAMAQPDSGNKIIGLSICRNSASETVEQSLPQQPRIETQLQPGDCAGLPDDQVNDSSRCRETASDAVGRNTSLKEPRLETQFDSGDSACLPVEKITGPSMHRRTGSGVTAPTLGGPRLVAELEDGDCVRQPDVQVKGQPERRSTALDVLQSLQVLSDIEECPLGPALEEPLQVSDDEEGRPGRGSANGDFQSHLAQRRKQLHSQLFAKRRRQTVRGSWPQGSWPQSAPEAVKAEPLLSAKREHCIKRELGASPAAASPEASFFLKRRRRGCAPLAEDDDEGDKPPLQAEGRRSLHGLPREDLLQLAGQLERRFLYR